MAAGSGFKKLVQIQPGTTASIIYTVPAGKAAVIKEIRAVNTTEGSGGITASFRLYHDGTSVFNQIQGDVSLAPQGTYIDDGSKFLETGDTIAAKSSNATSITVTIYGVEVDA